jgi:hypothetical protein
MVGRRSVTSRNQSAKRKTRRKRTRGTPATFSTTQRTSKAIEQTPEHRARGGEAAKASSDVERTGGNTDAMGVSRHYEGIGKTLNELRNKSKRKQLEHQEEGDSPEEAGDEPDELGSKTAVPGDIPSEVVRPRDRENERNDVSNARTRDTGPRGQMSEQDMMDDIEGDWRRQSDGDGIKYNDRRWRMYGAMSTLHCDPKRVETRALAGSDRTGQHGW